MARNMIWDLLSKADSRGQGSEQQLGVAGSRRNEGGGVRQSTTSWSCLNVDDLRETVELADQQRGMPFT